LAGHHHAQEHSRRPAASGDPGPWCAAELEAEDGGGGACAADRNGGPAEEVSEREAAAQDLLDLENGDRARFHQGGVDRIDDSSSLSMGMRLDR
jgi:hypothetical protein